MSKPSRDLSSLLQGEDAVSGVSLGKKKAGTIAGFHQERYDGKGYPDGLMGEDIPLGTRILCVADSVDAMLSDRAYRNGIGVGNTIIQLQRRSGTQFDPVVANVAIGLLSDREFVDEMRKVE